MLNDNTSVVVSVPVMNIKNHLQKIVRWFNSITCMVMNGGHELYVVRHEGKTRNDNKVFQQCLLCGHETKGWAATELKVRK